MACLPVAAVTTAALPRGIGIDYANELYLGLRHNRVRGEEYDQFVDRFVTTARKIFPNAYIHL